MHLGRDPPVRLFLDALQINPAREEAHMPKKKPKPKPVPLSKWAEGAIKRINETFPTKEESQHPMVVFTRLLVLAKDCGIDVFKEAREEAAKQKGSKRP